MVVDVVPHQTRRACRAGRAPHGVTRSLSGSYSSAHVGQRCFEVTADRAQDHVLVILCNTYSAYQSVDRASVAPALPRRGPRRAGGPRAVGTTDGPQPAHRRAHPVPEHRTSPRRRHRVIECRQFLAQFDRATPPELALHLIVDNSSTQPTEAIREFPAAHPRFHLHFTPTSASWLNAVETWFGQLQRRALRRGVLTSVTDLRQAIRHFIETHNAHAAKPFRWTKSAQAILDAVGCARETVRKDTSRTAH